MPIMSTAEQAFCRSAPWRYIARRAIVPWALDNHQLDGDVLEIGAGSGAMAQSVAERFPSAQFTITDLDPTMVASAQRNLARLDNVTVREADVTALPFEDASFDHVTSYLMLHHIVQWPAALTEARRVLRPGGTLLGYDLRHSRPAVAIHVMDRSPYHLLGPRELRDGLHAAGFGSVVVRHGLASYAMKFVATK